MKKAKFVLRHVGEFSYTEKVLDAPYTGQNVDLEVQAKTILSDSDWRPAPVPLYEIRQIEIPNWISPEEFVSNNFRWKWWLRIGGNEDLGRKAFFKIASIENGYYRLAILKLLKQKTFRSAFRQSLRLQIDEWLQGESDYQYPLSARQFDYITNDYLKREAKSLGIA